MTEKALPISVLELEAIHLTVLHWLKQLTGLTVLVTSDNSMVVSYINKQGGTRSISLCRQTKRLLFMCQNSKIVLRGCHIPECPVSPNSDVRYRVVPTPFCLPNSHTGVGNSIAGFIHNKVEPQTSKCPGFVSHGSGYPINELEGNVGTCLSTCRSVTTSSREGPMRRM